MCFFSCEKGNKNFDQCLTFPHRKHTSIFQTKDTRKHSHLKRDTHTQTQTHTQPYDKAERTEERNTKLTLPEHTLKTRASFVVI